MNFITKTVEPLLQNPTKSITEAEKRALEHLGKIETIDTAKAFAINLDTLLLEIDSIKDVNFIGSIETEFNTTEDMVFPYPA